MSYMVKTLTVEFASEDCNVDVNVLHDTLLRLPAEKYLALYKLMSEELKNNLIPPLPFEK